LSYLEILELQAQALQKKKSIEDKNNSADYGGDVNVDNLYPKTTLYKKIEKAEDVVSDGNHVLSNYYGWRKQKMNDLEFKIKKTEMEILHFIDEKKKLKTKINLKKSLRISVFTKKNFNTISIITSYYPTLKT